MSAGRLLGVVQVLLYTSPGGTVHITGCGHGLPWSCAVRSLCNQTWPSRLSVRGGNCCLKPPGLAGPPGPPSMGVSLLPGRGRWYFFFMAKQPDSPLPSHHMASSSRRSILPPGASWPDCHLWLLSGGYHVSLQPGRRVTVGARGGVATVLRAGSLPCR